MIYHVRFIKGDLEMERLQCHKFKITLFVLPALVIYSVFLVYPIFQAFFLSLNKWNGISGEKLVFVGLNNFYDIFTTPAFWGSFKNLSYFMGLNVLIQIPIGLILAYILSIGFKGTRFFTAAFFIPIILSTTSISLMWRFILYPDEGLIDTILKNLGKEDLIHAWLVDPKTAVFTLILIGCWQNMGVVMVLFLSGIVSIPESIFESANLDGANSVNKLFRITIPKIWETVKINIKFLIINSIKVFDIVYIMTKGGPNNLTDVPATLMVKEAFEKSKYGTSSAIAVVIFVFAFLVTRITNRVMKKETVEF